MEDREDPERSLWPLVEGGRSEEEEGEGFFVLIVEKVERVGLLRSSDPKIVD